MSAPLILGAGPAGCAAAIALARAGARPLLIDRDANVEDALCGGFLSWRTLEQLDTLGVDCRKLGARRVERLRLFDGDNCATAVLPQPGYGLSRRTLDTALREAALANGARLEIDTIRGLAPGVAQGKWREWRSDSVFLATGKHDVRGQSRPRTSSDTTLGLRLRLPPSPARQALLAGAIELHAFRGGYAGIVLQEDGSANVCFALRKSALSRCGGDPHALLSVVGNSSRAFGARLDHDWWDARIDTIGAVPYGWLLREGRAGLFRLGDQAAVIPSLAGEGISIAIASGISAASHWAGGGAEAAPRYQRAFARQAAGPMRTARLARLAAESPLGSTMAVAAARFAPRLLGLVANWTRIEAKPSLAPASRPA